jgi:hypothetical protein
VGEDFSCRVGLATLGHNRSRSLITRHFGSRINGLARRRRPRMWSRTRPGCRSWRGSRCRAIVLFRGCINGRRTVYSPATSTIPLAARSPYAQLEKKVKDYLRKSQALEDYWQRPITATGERPFSPSSFRARPGCGGPTDSPQRTAPERENAHVPLFNPPEVGNSFLTCATHQRGVGRGFATGRGRGMGVGLGP